MPRGKHKKGYKRPPPPPVDRGTPEVIRLRSRLAGRTEDGRPVDPAKASHPLDLMAARGLIDDDQYGAGLRYGWLGARASGRSQDPGEPRGLGVPCCAATPACRDCTAARVYAAWLVARNSLPDTRAKRAVENLCLYDRWPRWLLVLAHGRLAPRPSDKAEMDALIRGLNALINAGCVKRKEAKSALD